MTLTTKFLKNFVYMNRIKILFWYSIGIFLLTVFSFYNESLMPFLKKQQYFLAFKETISYLLFLIAIVMISSGAYLTLIDIFNLVNNEDYLKKVDIVQNRKKFSQQIVAKTRKFILTYKSY